MAKRTIAKGSKAYNRKQIALKSSKAFKSVKHSGIDKISKASTNPHRILPKEAGGQENFYRSKAKIKLLNLYNSKPNKDRFKRPDKPSRIEPDRKWFGNTRTITQKKLEELRKEVVRTNEEKHNSYSIFLNKSHLPQSLINPLTNQGTIKSKLISFEDTFGKKSKRTRPNLEVYTFEELADNRDKLKNEYNQEKDSNLNYLKNEDKAAPEMKFMKAGQSKRIYNELLKVVDASDVLCEILDSRDPYGTRCTYVENFIKKNCPHKHIIYIINKCDLVPVWVTAAYVKHLSKEYPTIAFHASITNPFGKPALFQLLRQFDALHKDKKNISVGFIGYPNVGKSSVINTLKKQKCCKSAPIPGETKVWQYVALTKRIYLIDCPGVVYEEGQSQMDRVLKNVVRAEKIEEPIIFIQGILDRANADDLKNIYKIKGWKDTEDFLGQCAKNYGKLLRGGEPDFKAISKMILMDWQRGKIPYFIKPPVDENEKEIENLKELENINNKFKDIEGIAVDKNEVFEEKLNMNQKYNIEQDLKEIENIKINNEKNKKDLDDDNDD